MHNILGSELLLWEVPQHLPLNSSPPLRPSPVHTPHTLLGTPAGDDVHSLYYGATCLQMHLYPDKKWAMPGCAGYLSYRCKQSIQNGTGYAQLLIDGLLEKGA